MNITSSDDPTFTEVDVSDLAFRGSNVTDISSIFINDYAASGHTGRFFVDDLLVTVPEPATLALLGCGGLMMAIVLWRRRRRV